MGRKIDIALAKFNVKDAVELSTPVHVIWNTSNGRKLERCVKYVGSCAVVYDEVTDGGCTWISVESGASIEFDNGTIINSNDIFQKNVSLLDLFQKALQNEYAPIFDDDMDI